MSFNTGGVSPEFVQQMANNYQNGTVPEQGYDPQQSQQFLQQVPPEQFQQYATQAIQQVPPQEYSNHITPGVGGTNPLGGLGGGLLGQLAGGLLNSLTGGQGNTQQAANQIGLRTSDPNQMNEGDVAQMGRYAQQNNPGALGSTAAQYQNKPDVLQAVLGNRALTVALGGLAAAAMSGKIPGVTPRFGPAAH